MAVILVTSALLRLILVANGGQFFWIDESHRFHPCLVIFDALRYPNHTWTEIADTIALQHLHTGFLLVGIPLAALGVLLMSVVEISSIQTAAAYLLSFTSVATIALVYLVARRLDAGRWESVLAAFLMATANCNFYYARHVLPYDSSLALTLLALWWSLAPRRSVGRSFVFGLLGGTAYLVYFGYLTTVLAIFLIDVGRRARVRDALIHGVAVGAGFVTLPLAMHAYTLVHSGGAMPFLNDLFTLMQRADQGGYAEGWAVPWAYLWYSEHGMLVLWLVGAAAVVALHRRGGDASHRRGALWLTIAGLIYAQLVLNSTVLENAVVLGRFARQLVPFLCLATAAAACDLAARSRLPRGAWAAATAAVAVQAAVNFAGPLGQWFAADVDRAVAAAYPGVPVARNVSVVGPQWEEPIDRSARLVLLNTVTFLYPAEAVAPPIAGTTLFRRRHPLQFRPYQYEVYDAAGRAVLQTADISMRLVDTGLR